MNTALTSAVKAGTIAIDLQAVRFILLDAARRVDDGCQCAERGDQNGAIGAALGLDAMLNDAKRSMRLRCHSSREVDLMELASSRRVICSTSEFSSQS